MTIDEMTFDNVKACALKCPIRLPVRDGLAPVGTGEFGAMMEVSLVNDGPTTICMDTKNKE